MTLFKTKDYNKPEPVNETTLREKEEFYSNLNTQDVTDADYMHAIRVCKDFEMKNFGEYHDLNLKSDTLLSDDVFENFREMCLKIYDLDPVISLFSSWVSMASSVKKKLK